MCEWDGRGRVGKRQKEGQPQQGADWTGEAAAGVLLINTPTLHTPARTPGSCRSTGAWVVLPPWRETGLQSLHQSCGAQPVVAAVAVVADDSEQPQAWAQPVLQWQQLQKQQHFLRQGLQFHRSRHWKSSPLLPPLPSPEGSSRFPRLSPGMHSTACPAAAGGGRRRHRQPR